MDRVRKRKRKKEREEGLGVGAKRERERKGKYDKANGDKINLNKEYMSRVLFYSCKIV